MKKSEYLKKAKQNIVISVDGIPFNASPRVFSTKSVGYNASGKVKLPLGEGGELIPYQVSINITAVGSKEWEDDTQAAA